MRKSKVYLFNIFILSINYIQSYFINILHSNPNPNPNPKQKKLVGLCPGGILQGG